MAMLTAYFRDPVTLVMLAATAVGILIAAGPRRRRHVWLLALTVMLFALPRAGVVITQIHLPLPIAHVMAAAFIVEWFVLRKTRLADRSRIGFFVLLYASMAALGLMIGLARGGNTLIGCIELSFYVFSLGLYFYASETFTTQRHFTTFCRVVLLLSVVVSLYGIAQEYLGAKILIDNVTYTSGGETARGYVATGDNPLVSRRVLSSYGDPNVLSTQLIFFVAIGLALVLGRGISRYVRGLALLVVAANVVCVLYTGSLAGKVSLVLVLLGIFCWRYRWALRVVIFTAMVLLAAATPYVIDALIAGDAAAVAGTGDARWGYPRIAWQLLQAVPMGCGFGNTVRLHATAAGWSFEVVRAGGIWAGFNSFWLNLLSRLGVPGVASLMLLILMLLRYVVRQVRLVPVGWVRAFVVGGLIGFGCQWLVGCVNNTYMLPGGGLNYWFMMGMIVAGCRAFAVRPYPVIFPPLSAGSLGKLTTTKKKRKPRKKVKAKVKLMEKEKIRESCILIDE